jgi:hypothetical protein
MERVTLYFEFDVLDMFTGTDGTVDWRLTSATNIQFTSLRPPGEVYDIALCDYDLRELIPDGRSTWTPGHTLDSCIGKHCALIVITDDAMHVYFDQSQPLRFLGLYEIVSAKRVLFFHDDSKANNITYRNCELLQAAGARVAEEVLTSPEYEHLRSSANRSERELRGAEYTAALRDDGVLASWDWSMDKIVLRFQSFELSVYMNKFKQVDLRIDRIERTRRTQGSPTFSLVYGGREQLWSPGDILYSCVGRKCARVIPGLEWPRVCFDGLPPLWFWPIRESVNGGDFVFFEEDGDCDIVRYQ